MPEQGRDGLGQPQLVEEIVHHNSPSGLTRGAHGGSVAQRRVQRRPRPARASADQRPGRRRRTPLAPFTPLGLIIRGGQHVQAYGYIRCRHGQSVSACTRTTLMSSSAPALAAACSADVDHAVLGMPDNRWARKRSAACTAKRRLRAAAKGGTPNGPLRRSEEPPDSRTTRAFCIVAARCSGRTPPNPANRITLTRRLPVGHRNLFASLTPFGGAPLPRTSRRTVDGLRSRALPNLGGGQSRLLPAGSSQLIKRRQRQVRRVGQQRSDRGCDGQPCDNRPGFVHQCDHF
jgi:hypothetical protein